nr:MAG TPA_asm: hypothetical protein [Caudoviricetes sp.]
MDIKIIKCILDNAKECGCIAGISLSNGQFLMQISVNQRYLMLLPIFFITKKNR